jgi:hypothetical protein
MEKEIVNMNQRFAVYKKTFQVTILVLLQFVLISPLLPAQNNILKIKSTTDFIITGDGSSENWNKTDWNNLPQHTTNALKNAGWNLPAVSDDLHYQTSFKVLYSNKGIYCLFRCEDSVVTATLKGDYLNLYDEDVVEIFLRPDTTFPGYFEYELSPLNYELPILIVNKGNITGWRPWQYEGETKIKHEININRANSSGNRITWTAEIFIPFRLLEPLANVPAKKGTRWRANFYRIDYDRNPIYFGWQMTRQGFHDPEKFGIIEFE